MTKKLYLVMYGQVGDYDQDARPHSIYSSEAAACSNAALLEMPDGDEQDTYAYVVEVDFYD